MYSKIRTRLHVSCALATIVTCLWLLAASKAEAACDAGQCTAFSQCFDSGFCVGGQACSAGKWLSVKDSQPQCGPVN
jgi:hypothetical protein